MRSDSNADALVAAALPRRRRSGRLGGLRVPNGAQVMHRPFDEVAPSGRDGITAAAQVLSVRPMNRKKKQPKRATSESWQAEAWELRDETGELRFIGDRQARAASQARLFVGKKVDPTGTPEPVDDGIGAEVSAALFANVGLSEQVVKRAAQHLIYNGESNLLVAEDEDTGQLVWSAHSVSELTGSPGRWKLSDGVEQREVNDATEILIRCWTPHPEWLARADAPVRAVLPIARELRALSMYVSAQVESRLAGAGLLLLPEGIESMHSQGGDDDDDLSFADELTDYFVTPVTNRDTAAAVTPFMATVDPELIDKIKHLRFDTPLDEHAPELRDESIRRVGLGMDSDPSVLLGQASSNHWCKDELTEILARGKGWVTHESLEIGDEVMTLNHETGASEWQPVLDIYRADVVDEPMLSMESASHSSLSTAAHRWPIIKAGKRVAGSRRRWTTSEAGFAQGDRVPLAAACGNLPDAPKYSDEFVKLVAAYTADGTLLSYESGTRYARIVKFDDEEIADIRAIVCSVFGRQVSEFNHPTRTCDGVAFAFHADETAMLTSVAPGDEKVVDRAFVESLTLAQLHLFIESMIRIGDGVTDTSGSRTIYQVSSNRLDAFELAAILAGYKVTRGRRNQQTGYGNEPLFWLRISEQSVFTPWACESVWTEYTGVVWCPTTSNSTWFARRNGQSFFTGNSAWAVDESEIKYGVQPILATICHALTVGLLRPLLIDKGVPPHEVDLYSVWYDTTQLIVRPDRSKDAQALFDKDVISAAVLRQENGFSDVDAPAKDEMNRAVLLSLLQSRPDWADKILPLLGIVIPGIGGAEETADEAAAEVETAPGAELAKPGDLAVEGVAPEPPNSPPVLGETEATR